MSKDCHGDNYLRAHLSDDATAILLICWCFDYWCEHILLQNRSFSCEDHWNLIPARRLHPSYHLQKCPNQVSSLFYPHHAFDCQDVLSVAKFAITSWTCAARLLIFISPANYSSSLWHQHHCHCRHHHHHSFTIFVTAVVSITTLLLSKSLQYYLYHIINWLWLCSMKNLLIQDIGQGILEIM